MRLHKLDEAAKNSRGYRSTLILLNRNIARPP